MKKMPFKKSLPLSLGIELELQIVNARTQSLIARAKDLMRAISQSSHEKQVKPEITQSMIEINSSIHQSPQTLLTEMTELRNYLVLVSKEMQVHFSGGGTHPFQKWTVLKIFPSLRFKHLSHHYRYLSKRSTVFGQHIHIGCKNADDALYLTYALVRYLPHFITLSASSPFYQGIDTGYQSARSNIFNVFPSSGLMPYFTDWIEFSKYFYKMRALGIIQSMKDLYWDVRPKPEFGTVEIRVCDTPLTIEKSVQIAAYAQALAAYIMDKRPIKISKDLYYLYGNNRFQAIRYGFDGTIIDAESLKQIVIKDDIMQTFNEIKPYIQELHTEGFLSQLEQDVNDKINDALLLRKIKKQTQSLQQLVEKQCQIWAGYE